MSAESPGLSDHEPTFQQAVRSHFRAWRWQRPFWAGLLTILGGIPIAYFPYANMTLGQLTVRMSTTAGAGSLVIGILLMVLGLTMWFQPLVRIFAGVAAILLSLVSIPVSNFGGFLIGFLLGLFGGALAIAWAPGVPAAEPVQSAELPDDTADGGHAEPQSRPQLEKHAVSPGAGADEETTNDNGRHRAG
ncbi:DUF6114 domain-containing protein [Streptomyces sp. H10-C2]|uniref:DUF6114 domain-containing protein n=1 Tax=unclassified Streptomyces TaxID=2593676 RepID=UPI0024B91EFD|nr:MULTISPECIES: DUF6114 domain-containing protein [unclassified Streptomyces]MDJ0341477.1 DUF6114 domain-containing protein [Streptomyces sp. PH10-H1]MDJ0369134.1 DUF6114 domain-containing protein [Streptomyces sp. H10-C2]